MLPSGGSITVVLPLRMWSPLNSRPSSRSSRHRWLAAWPGVWTTSRVWVTSPSSCRPLKVSRSPSANARSGVNRLAARAVGAEGMPSTGGRGRPAAATRAASGAAPGAWSAWGVRAHDGADIATRRMPEALEMHLVGRAGVDGDVAGGRVAHQVAVGARAGHGAGVGRGQPLQVAQQRHGPLGLPVERMHDLPVGADQGQFTVGGLVLHVARLAARQQAGARATGPQRLLVGHGGEHRVGAGEFRQPLQRADGREDHEELAGRMPLQRVARAHPDGLELLGLVGHRLLPLRHACHQEGHVEAPGQVAVGRPVREQEDRVGRQAQAARGALRHEGARRGRARRCPPPWRSCRPGAARAARPAPRSFPGWRRRPG